MTKRRLKKLYVSGDNLYLCESIKIIYKELIIKNLQISREYNIRDDIIVQMVKIKEKRKGRKLNDKKIMNIMFNYNINTLKTHFIIQQI